MGTIYAKRTEQDPQYDLYTENDWLELYYDEFLDEDLIADIFINNFEPDWLVIGQHITEGTAEDAQRIGEIVIQSLRKRLRNHMIEEAKERIGVEYDSQD